MLNGVGVKMFATEQERNSWHWPGMKEHSTLLQRGLFQIQCSNPDPGNRFVNWNMCRDRWDFWIKTSGEEVSNNLSTIHNHFHLTLDKLTINLPANFQSTLYNLTSSLLASSSSTLLMMSSYSSSFQHFKLFLHNSQFIFQMKILIICPTCKCEGKKFMDGKWSLYCFMPECKLWNNARKNKTFTMMKVYPEFSTHMLALFLSAKCWGSKIYFVYPRV